MDKIAVISKKFLSNVLPYPYKLKAVKDLEPTRGIWGIIKQRHLRNIGTSRARGLLKEDVYHVPLQLQEDAARVIETAFETLNSDKVTELEGLNGLMLQSLAEEFIAGNKRMVDDGIKVNFISHTKPKVTIEGYYFTYGPFPIPDNYVPQSWLDFITFVIPIEDADFESHPKQNEITAKAANEGCYFRIDTRVDWDLEFVLTCTTTDVVLVRDRRKILNVSFLSPHFTPWDEIFHLQKDGRWKLAWDWKISDIDSLLASRIKFEDNSS